MKIPKRFNLGPHVWTVKIVPQSHPVLLSEDGESLAGCCVEYEQVIFLEQVSKGFSKSSQVQTFWHEFYHALFHTLNRSALNEDEMLVDNCGTMTAQAVHSFSNT